MPMTFTLNVNGKFCFIKTVVDGSKIQQLDNGRGVGGHKNMMDNLLLLE